MAAIESLDGISRKNGHEYRVTKQVVVAANIDDVVESAFIIEDGGRLMFGNGCTTTFTRCDFVELKSMQVFQTSSMASNNHKSRFQAGCKPVFRGCSFKLENEMRSNSFGVTPTAAPEFRADQFGRPTYFFIDNRYHNGINFWYWNAWRSPDMKIDGVVWDMKGPKDLTFVVPPPIKNLKLIDNKPGDGGRVLTFLCQYWASGATYEITGIGSRNVCLWSSDASKTLIVTDPVGTVRRSVDGAGRGKIVVKRTYKALPFDPLANAAVSVKTYLKNTDNNEVIIDRYSDGLEEKLLSYTIPHEKKNEADHVFENNYIRGFYRYGFESQNKVMTILPDEKGEQYDDGSVLMLPDASITEPDKNVVDAYPITLAVSDSAVTITGGAITTRQAYDAICAHLEDNWKAVDLRAGRAGDMLDVGSRALSLTSVDGDLQSSGAITVAEITEGRVIKDSPNVTIEALPANLILDNAILNIGPGADVTDNTELNGGGYKATGNGEYIARGKSASIIDANGFTITVVTAALPTPSTMNFVADGARWAIYDNNNGFVESGSGNKTFAHTGGVDAGVWTIVSHKKGYAGQIDRWMSDDGSIANLTFVSSQIRRSTGEVAWTDDPFPDASTSVTAGRIHTLIANKAVGPQQIINAQQSFLNTDAGLNWIRQNQPPDYPTWAAMNGITYLLTKEGFTYDSVSGVTPEAAISATLISSASHDNILLTNGGVTVSDGALTGADIATAVWAAQRTDHAAEGTMGEAQSAAADMATITAQNTQT